MKIFHPIIILFLFTSTIFAQSHSGPDYPPLPCDAFWVNNTASGPYYIKLMFYATDPIQSIDLHDAVEMTNQYFEDHNIYFYSDCILYDQEPSEIGPIYVWITDSGSGGSATGLKIAVSQSVVETPVLAHELGHALGLGHTYQQSNSTCNVLENVQRNPSHVDYNCLTCGDCLCDTDAEPENGTYSNCVLTSPTNGPDLPYEINKIGNNIMGLDPANCGQFFTDDQGQRMRNVIEYESSRPVSTLNQEDIIVPNGSVLSINNTDYPQGFVVPNNIYVYGSLIISGTNIPIYFNDPNGTITLLNDGMAQIDGAILQASNCSSTWRGIKLNNADSEIRFNNSKILNTGTAISSRGGLVTCDNSIFENNSRGVEILPDWNNLLIQNNSTFTDCTFKDMYRGVSIWRTSDVLFDHCFFIDCSIYSIKGIDANLELINSPEISGSYNAITLSYPGGGISENNIENNLFFGNSYDLTIRSSGGVSENMITQNTFTSYLGVWIDSDNGFRVENNNFINSYGNVILDSGNSIGITDNNSISSNIYGIWVYGQNPMYQFSRNCFNGNFSGDIRVNGELSNQGIITLANANCFSTTNPDILATNSNSFIYWEPVANLNPDLCELPVTQGSYITDIASDHQSFQNCGTGLIQAPQYNFCYPENSTEQELLNYIAEVENYMLATQNDPLLP
ncbi:MAG: hypothetical protein HKN09_04350 [Saprospiraceae bacterium]|nr:hypothetical protein [Saprospiraceae bacterium]